MFFGRTIATYYRFLVVASTLIQTISNQCLPPCSNVRDSQAKCCTTLTSNATSTFTSSVDLVTANPETITTAHSPIVQKTNFSLKANTDTISCGRRMLDNNKIVGGSETKFGEFPWMAVVFYSKHNHNECAGSAIQRKYILTAAHCLVGRILYVMGKPYKVRLGEHDLNTDPDCTANSICAPNAVDIDISSTHPHPKYQSNARSSFDIGLIKLVDEIVYNDYIQPICYDQNVDFVGQWFYVAGWGKTETAEKSNRLLKVRIPYANITKCQQVYNSINVRDDQICAGGDKGVDSCRGDSGAPLILLKNNNWSVVGIVSKGHSLCGTADYPALYTRVDVHLKWLQRKMLSA